MKQTIVAVLLISIQALKVSSEEKYAITCSEHEVFDECVNACPPTCRTPHPTPCPSFTCSKGCSCKPGLILNEDTGLCIAPEKCRKECKRNEYWSECGSACILTCQNRNNPPFCPAAQACQPGCVCRRGFIFDEVSRRCVLPNKCPDDKSQKCTGLNEEYSTCASLCPPTCQDKCKSDPTACAAVCVNGCKCKSGFIKDDATGNCIREQDCPTCQS